MNKFKHHSIFALCFAVSVTSVFVLLFYYCQHPGWGMVFLNIIDLFPNYVTQHLVGYQSNHKQAILFILVFSQWFLISLVTAFLFERLKLRDYAACLIVLAWIASIISLPIFFFAIIGIGMSDGPSPNATASDLLILASCPVIATVAIVFALTLHKVTIWRFVSIILPGLISLAELVITFIVWREG